ncbi:MAG: 2Fe-2S iron-sulfur cluster binding domain-containing protein [Betaproteobacteria bacterium]|nr:2Fe-2S iron-sulfur cluster binding domain-containing protein [Betaproteobacteria bacterium]
MAIAIHSMALLATLLTLVYLGFLVQGAFRRQSRMAQLHHEERALLRARLDLLATPLAKISSDKAQAAWSGFRKFRIDGKVLEAESCCSFYLAPHDGRPLPPFLPGQYLTFKLQVPGQSREITRCYSLSDSPDHTDYYRVTIKRIPPPPNMPDVPSGVGSSHFHDRLQVGDIIDVKAPSGNFHLDVQSRTPVVLIAGGIGVTPALSIMNHLITAPGKRDIWFFYGVRNGREHILKDYLAEVAAQHSNVHLVVCYSDPLPDEKVGEDFQFSERVSVDLFKLVLEVNNFDFYICGPPPMMESLTKGLSEWGVPDSKVHFEAFGPASVKKVAKVESTAAVAAAGSLAVNFARSNKMVTWSGTSGTLLELAEANGIRLDSGCRAGSCGTCMTAIREGKVDYPSGKPGFDIEKGSCLACVAVPTGALTLDA